MGQSPVSSSTSPQQKLAKLEALRGLAAGYVVVGHIAPSCWLLKFGQEAAMLFFLLSGFVIEYSCSQNPPKTFGAYFKKRWLRIYPPLLILFGLVAVLGSSETAQNNFGTILLGNLAMLQDFDLGKPNVIVPTLFAPALWSLHYEWWFYMAYYPLRKIRPSNRGNRCVITAAVVASVLYCFWPQVLPRLVMYLITWWLGVVLAQSYLKNSRVNLRDLKEIIIGLIACIAVLGVNVATAQSLGGSLSWGLHPVLELRHFLSTFVILAVALIWQRLGWRGFKFFTVGSFIAPISYSLYIGHQPLWAYAQFGQSIEAWWLRNLLHLGVLLTFCYLVEMVLQPVLRRRFRPKG